jgi:hypothetical protein
LSYGVMTGGWWQFGDLFIAKSSRGPQGAEAIIFWTDVGRGNQARACGQWWGSPVGTIRDWAEQASKGRSELLLGPTSATVGGFAAQHLVFVVSDARKACDPGFFHTWKNPIEGPFWSGIEVGDTVRIWLVDIGDKILYIEADTHAYADPQLEREVERIVGSISLG